MIYKKLVSASTLKPYTEYVYASTQGIWESLSKQLTAEYSGRVEIFCFNTSDIAVYFDNFTIDLKPVRTQAGA